MKNAPMEIIRTIIRHRGNRRIFLVGGYIRDRLLGRETNDMDLALSPGAKQFAVKLAGLFKGTFVLLDRKNRIYRVVIDHKGEPFNIDFSELRGKDISIDLSLRDFTINAMALDLSAPGAASDPFNELIDPFGGRDDLKKRIIRKVSDRVFKDDPLRMLRAYRLKAELAFEIERKTENLIKKQSRLIKIPAKERVHDELIKIFATDNSSGIIYAIDRQKLLEKLIPEILVMKKSARKFYFHREGLWQHAKESLSALEYALNNMKKYAGGYTDAVNQHIRGKEPFLKFVALLHDTGKPRTAKVIRGRTRFFGHEEIGENIVKKIFGRLKMSRKETQAAGKLVKNHMRPSGLSRLSDLTERAVYRYFRDIGDESVELLLLSLADVSSYLPPFAVKRRGKASYGELKTHVKFIRNMIKRFFNYKEKKSEKRLIDGNLVMKKFSLSPGPLIGNILKHVQENQALGRIRTTEQALRSVKQYLQTQK